MARSSGTGRCTNSASTATWFCVQCLTRLAQGLPISLLELNTFGHALCALLIYSMWWRKPLDVAEPELIPVQGKDMEEIVAALWVECKYEVYQRFQKREKHGELCFFMSSEPSGPVKDDSPVCEFQGMTFSPGKFL